MNSANDEKTRDLEQELIDIEIPATKDSYPAKERSRKMYQRIFCGLLLLLVCTLSMASALHVAGAVVDSYQTPKNPTMRDKQRFQDVLDSIEPPAPHGVLHEKVDKYKHGCFQGDKTAMAVVHQQTPEVASSLVELAKRQASNGTTSVPPVTSTTDITTEATSTLTTPVTSSTVVTQSSAVPSSSSASAESSATKSDATSIVTTTASSSEVVVSSETATPTSSPSKGSSSPTGASGSPASSQSSALPSSLESNNPTESSSTSEKSSPTSATSVTSFNIFTTTLPNGKPTTVTQTTVVPAGQPDQTPVGASASKTNPGASLQTNGAGTMKLSVSVMVGMVGMVFYGAL